MILKKNKIFASYNMYHVKHKNFTGHPLAKERLKYWMIKIWTLKILEKKRRKETQKEEKYKKITKSSNFQ